MSTAMEGNRPRGFKIIVPIEKKDGSTYWLRVGSAYPNKDNSINLYLDAMPVGNNKLQLRELTEEDFQKRRPGGELPLAAGRATDLPF